MKLTTGRKLSEDKYVSNHHKQEVNLLDCIAKGDENALERLYHGYYSRLLRFIARVTGGACRHEELINEVMFVVWQKAGSYNHNCQPSTWIFGIAYNIARKSMQRTKFDECQSLDSVAAENPSLSCNDIGLQQLEMDDWLETAFDVLAPEQRAVIELTYFHGMHYREIAKIMDCPENTVKTRMHHARKKLAPVLLRLEEKVFIRSEK